MTMVVHVLFCIRNATEVRAVAFAAGADAKADGARWLRRQGKTVVSWHTRKPGILDSYRTDKDDDAYAEIYQLRVTPARRRRAR